MKPEGPNQYVAGRGEARESDKKVTGTKAVELSLADKRLWRNGEWKRSVSEGFRWAMN